MAKNAGPVAHPNGANKQKHLTKDELLALLAEKRDTFTLPGGGLLTLRSIDVREMDTLSAMGDQGIADRTKKICLLGIVEPKLDVDDLEALNNARMGLLDKIALKILELSGQFGEESTSFLTLIPR